jgi:hypothetical protein
LLKLSSRLGRVVFYELAKPISCFAVDGPELVVTPDVASRTLAQWLEEHRWTAKQNAGRDPFTAKLAKKPIH